MASREIDRATILALVTELVDGAANRQALPASGYLLEPASVPAADRAVWDLPGEQFELALSRAQFRPPFEWLAEITVRSAAAEEGPEHFLITETDVVAAQRRELTPLNPAEIASLYQRLGPLRQRV